MLNIVLETACWQRHLTDIFVFTTEALVKETVIETRALRMMMIGMMIMRMVVILGMMTMMLMMRDPPTYSVAKLSLILSVQDDKVQFDWPSNTVSRGMQPKA